MGENKHIKELDAFTKKYIKEIDIESPSADFTANLMGILKKENAKIYKPTPLISNKMWSVLVMFLVGSILYVSKGTSVTWMKMPKIDLSYMSSIEMPNLFGNITVSNTMLYACFFFTLMIFFQVHFLKNHFTKNLN
ncbi:hypothetical protein [Tenacibaculum haliotis]|uniref:hypothetical protein n=1 Tax=Tenacibaculum haliotis TaxID=1888914 RepID=UPI0021B04EDE|nr:hypothetical protein [Tenacibaculum haliotis]MCT4698292.1 hypothetical protein [Tenacibaculum haliotis]